MVVAKALQGRVQACEGPLEVLRAIPGDSFPVRDPQVRLGPRPLRSQPVPVAEPRGGFQVADGLLQVLGPVAVSPLEVDQARVVRQLCPRDGITPGVDMLQRRRREPRELPARPRGCQ